jgi:small subunit ribosomal protein S35
MAAALQSFRFAVRSCNCRHIARRHVFKSAGRGREFSTTPQQWKAPSIEEINERLSKAEATNHDVAEYKMALKEFEESSGQETIEAEYREILQQSMIDDQPYVLPQRRKKLKQTFMNMGEAEPWEEEGMLPDDQDDITTLAHGELEQHREMRYYARLAAWEMPLLSSKRSPIDEPWFLFEN